jgi:hypothetical protein
MRTTVRLNDGLLNAAKQEAHRRGVTLTSLIESGLRRELASAKEARPRRRIVLPVSRMGGGAAPGLDLHSNAAVQAFLDEGLPLGKLR